MLMPSSSSLLARLSERLPCTHLPRGFHLGQHQLHLLFSHVQIKVLLPVLADIRAGACKHKHHARAIRAVRALQTPRPTQELPEQAQEALTGLSSNAPCPRRENLPRSQQLPARRGMH